MRRGKLTVRHGPMWSDKTTWLINQFRKKGKSIAFKPILDNRYTDKAVLRNHNGDEVIAILVDQTKPDQLWRLIRGKKIDRVLIDETNFFNDELIKVVLRILNKGIDVCAAGLMWDSDRKEFGPTMKLARIAVGADTMRVGKTTAVEVLGKELKRHGLPVKISLEDWRHNPHFKMSYTDSSLAILESQKWFIKRKYDQILKAS